MFSYIKIHLPYTLSTFKNVNPCIICVTINYSFGNYLLTKFYSSSKCWSFILQYTNAFTSITIFITRKALKHWEASIFSEEYTVSKIPNFCLKMQILLLATYTVSFISLSDRFTSFWRKYLPNTIVVFFQAFLSSKTGASWKKSNEYGS